jgi:hypothetical protein
VIPFEPLSREAAIVDARARSIRIPNNDAGDLEAEYIEHSPTGKFGRMEIVPADRPQHEGSSPTFRKNVFDLSVAHNIASYDKLGSKNLISSVKYAVLCGGLGGAKTGKTLCFLLRDCPFHFQYYSLDIQATPRIPHPD